MTKEKLTKERFEEAFCELKQIIKPEEPSAGRSLQLRPNVHLNNSN